MSHCLRQNKKITAGNCRPKFFLFKSHTLNVGLAMLGNVPARPGLINVEGFQAPGPLLSSHNGARKTTLMPLSPLPPLPP